MIYLITVEPLLFTFDSDILKQVKFHSAIVAHLHCHIFGGF